MQSVPLINGVLTMTCVVDFDKHSSITPTRCVLLLCRQLAKVFEFSAFVAFSSSSLYEACCERGHRPLVVKLIRTFGGLALFVNHMIGWKSSQLCISRRVRAERYAPTNKRMLQTCVDFSHSFNFSYKQQ